MKELRITYDQKRDMLLVHVPHAISVAQLRMVRDAGYKIDQARWAQAGPGDSREVLGKKLRCYEADRIQQLVVNPKGEANFFKATQGTGRIISVGSQAIN